MSFFYKNIKRQSAKVFCSQALFLLILFVPTLTQGQMQFKPVTLNELRVSKLKRDSLRGKECKQKDIYDLFRKKGKEAKPPKRVMLLILPRISSNPANGFLFGVGSSIGWYLGPRKTTRVSFIGASVAVTTKNQLLSFIKSSIYTPNNKFFLQGDWRYYIYNAPTWGLGSNAPDTNFVNNSWIWEGADLTFTEGAFPMEYNYLKLHENVNYQIMENFYLGIGYQLDYYYNIKDELLKLDTLPKQITPHYGYSKYHGFDTTKYMLSGLSLSFFYDSRDNMINAYRGYFVNVNYRVNTTWLGSDQNSSSLWLEFRTYIPLSRRTPRHLIAFWAYGNIQVSGHQPYLTLMSVGEDQKGRSGRGYMAGRYRGEDLVYGEVEYRLPISQCSQLVGGVLFLNFTTSSNRDTGVALFQYVRPGVGIGFRFMLNKNFRTNLNIEFGFGHKSQGFYLSGTETF
jgi:hypothetical protein